MQESGKQIDSSSRFALNVGTEVVGGLAGFAVAGPIGAVIGAVGGQIILRAMDLDREQMERRAARVVQVVESAADYSDLPWEQLDERLRSDSLRAELYVRVLEAAGGSLTSEKIDGLARVLASAVPDDARLDEAFMVAAALREMERPQITALALINGGEFGGWFEPEHKIGGWEVGSRRALAEECGGEIVFPAVIATLVRLGLIEETSRDVVESGGLTSSETYWSSTKLGTLCLQLLYPTAPSWVEQAHVLRRRMGRRRKDKDNASRTLDDLIDVDLIDDDDVIGSE